jgi:NAD(P)-dependent dehydrogenase (short-subunit alcohol dehydrogenase family)
VTGALVERLLRLLDLHDRFVTCPDLTTARNAATTTARARASSAGPPTSVSADSGEAKILGPGVVFIPADVAVREDVERLVGETQERFGQIDCFVSNAGALASRPGRCARPGRSSTTPSTEPPRRSHRPLYLPRPYMGVPLRSAVTFSRGSQMQARSRAPSVVARQNRAEVASCEDRSCPQASHADAAWLSWVSADPGDWISDSLMSNRPDFASAGWPKP